jgi:hypothetical protein
MTEDEITEQDVAAQAEENRQLKERTQRLKAAQVKVYEVMRRPNVSFELKRQLMKAIIESAFEREGMDLPE